MNRLFSCLIVIVFAYLGAGCAIVDVENEIRFETEKEVYSSGDEVAVRLENELYTQVGLNLCFAFLTLEQQSTSGKWERLSVGLGPGENTVCTAEMLRLAPGRATGGAAYLPVAQDPGTYRLSTQLEVDNESMEVVTNSFEVQ